MQEIKIIDNFVGVTSDSVNGLPHLLFEGMGLLYIEKVICMNG